MNFQAGVGDELADETTRERELTWASTH